jgi:hypothetical protein
MEKPGGFDMSKMSMATKIIGGAGILLLIDSFLSWQSKCIDTGVFGNICGKANAWGGDGGFLGLLMGLCLIVLLVWEGLQAAGSAGNINLPISASKASAYLGFGVVGFGILKLIVVLTSDVKPAFFGWLGLLLILAVGYGAWMKFQEPEVATAPPAAPGGTDGGFTA